MKDSILIRLLQLQFEHDQKIKKFGPKLDFSYFDIDLLPVVLDAIGLPPDNTVEQEEKYGYPDYVDHEDTFCRDYWYDLFDEIIENGNPDECAAYLSRAREECQKYLSKQ